MRGRGAAERARANFDSLLSALEVETTGQSSAVLQLPYRAIAYAGLGRRKEAAQALHELLALGQRLESQGDRSAAGGIFYNAAIAYMLLGEAGAAVEQLQRWLILPTGGTPAYLRIDPILISLRDDPGFRRLVGGP
jgi:tetratricopeptide (TPR) repeat protein